ncbi:MAG: hypothetical protein AB2777_22290 [Candidatus Thiodiazotropha endolucinida]
MDNLIPIKRGRTRLVFLIFSTFLLSSCAATVEAENKQEQGKSPGLIAMQVLGSCEDGFKAEASPIAVAALTAIAPRLVDLGFSFFSEKLKEKAESYSVSYAAQNTTKYMAGEGDNAGEIEVQFPSCILIYGGSAGKWNGADNKSLYPVHVRQEKVKPEIFFVGELVVEPHNPYGLYYKIVPKVFIVNGKANKGTHDVVMEFQLKIPDGPIKGGVTVTSLLPPISNIEAGMAYSFDDTYSTKWEPLPTPKKITDTVSVPLTISAKVNRTKQGDGAFLFTKLAAVVEESKKEIVDAVKQEVEKVGED